MILSPSSPADADARDAFIRGVLPGVPDDVLVRFARALRAPLDELAAVAELVLDKPYGRNHVLVAGGEYGLSLAVLLPGRSTSLHAHELRREVFCVRTGVLSLTRGDLQVRIGAGELDHSTPGEPHALANEGDEVLEVLEIFSPALLDDKVRISDRYDRALGKVTREQ
ncbi:cupin domain-containing protein [Longimicrobium terrae]|uniref:Mannose-6-phosphate isomerase-like protein (Cupin superfamily) n=1 Tax=Longimicrobium terrae TaxID=1639882 RepID=A0A841H0E9_9BACT|nr:mannose-6-phosphate isomerase-like protein (cupin superfamily) [Longimicrobium terrae]MBB6071424.1 mannose-6-phosphate isomerase-like protein (cupin superfamily) [Longimicrobium terrae]NNC31355.1 cupin domain-containing protein [Longimicrobium terrae]